MGLTKIAFSGMKANDAQYDLSKVTLFVGPNGSGKSTVLNAISFAIMGYVPWKPGQKTLQSVGPLMRRAEAVVTLQTDGEFTLRRHIKRTKDKLSQSLYIDDAKVAQSVAASKIATHIGSFAPVFDLSRFTDISDEQKRSTLFSLYGHGAIDEVDLRSELLSQSDDIESITDELLRKCHGITVFGKIESLTELVKQRASAARKDEKDATAVLDAAHNADDPECRDVDAIADEQVAIDKEIDTLKEHVAKQRELEATITRETLREKTFSDNLAALRTRMEEFDDVDEADVASLEDAERKQDECEDAEDAIAKTLLDIESQIRSSFALMQSPAAQLIGRLDDFSATLPDDKAAELNAIIDDLKEHLGGSVDDVKRKAAALQQRCTQVKHDFDVARHATSDAEAECKRIRELKRKLAAKRELTESLVNAETAYTDACKTLREAQVAMDQLQPTEGIDDKLAQAQHRKDELKAERDKAVARTTHESMLDATRKKQEAAKATLDACKRFEKALQAVRAKLLDSLVGKLLTDMKPFCKHVFGDMEAYCDIEPFSIGVRKGKRKIPMEVLSGGERTIFAAGMLYSMTMAAESPISLLLIEASELDQHNLTCLIHCLEASDVDTAVIATCSAATDVSESCRVYSL